MKTSYLFRGASVDGYCLDSLKAYGSGFREILGEAEDQRLELFEPSASFQDARSEPQGGLRGC